MLSCQLAHWLLRLLTFPVCPSCSCWTFAVDIWLPACHLVVVALPCPVAGVLPELMPLAELLSANAEWQRDAAGVSALVMGCLSGVAAAYRRAGDPVSAAILLEASLRK